LTGQGQKTHPGKGAVTPHNPPHPKPPKNPNQTKKGEKPPRWLIQGTARAGEAHAWVGSTQWQLATQKEQGKAHDKSREQKAQPPKGGRRRGKSGPSGTPREWREGMDGGLSKAPRDRMSK
jgi:hypothetical protein